MGSRHWLSSLLGRGARGRKKTDLSPRRRDDWQIPLEVGRLEERRVLNVAPVLSGANNLTSVVRNVTTGANSGTLVSSIISGKVSDGDPGAQFGVAVTHVDNTHGTWQYSINGGTNWTNFGNPNSGNARLLAADANTRIRFQPNNSFSGTVSITIQAWDQTSGSNGGTGNAGNNGGTTAFSTASATPSILVNTAPTLSGAVDFTSINENATGNAGNLVSALISGKTSDADSNSVGIAITSIDNTNGKWQFSTDGGNSGGTWVDIPAVSASSALLLAADSNTYVRFVPNTNFIGSISPGITFRAWDGTTGTEGSAADASSNGGATAFSSTTASSGIIVDTPPTITGAVAGQTVNDNATISPFSAVTIGDTSTSNPTLTVTIALDNAANGQFTAASTSDPAWTVNVAGGIYVYTGTAANATTAINGLVFVPTNHQVAPGSTVTTHFTIAASDGILPAVSDLTTSVIATAVNNPPTIGGTVAGQTVNDNATATPFSGVTISDPDLSSEPATVTVTLSAAANGTFTAGSLTGWTSNVPGGIYTYTGTRAQAEAKLQALVFQPTNHQVDPGATVTTTFTIGLTDGSNSASDNTTTVIATAINNPPTISGTSANQAVNDNATISPFSAVTIGDPDKSTEPATITITLDTPANGQFTAASTSDPGWTTVDTAGGIYTFTGSRAQAQSALQGLVFTPTNHQVNPGSTVTSHFAIALTDGANSASDNTTSVVATAVNNPPTIQGTVAGQTVDDNSTLSPFSGVTISDVDLSTEPATITVQLDKPADGRFSAASTADPGWTTVNVAAGTYTFTGTRAAAEAALQGLVFAPTNHQVVPGASVTTKFTISLTDGANSTSNNTTTVIATAINNPPTITGTVAGQTVNDNATISLFSGVTISDPDNSSEPATITITLDTPANGQFSAASTNPANGWTTVNTASGIYTFTGTRAAAQSALQGLVFVPTNHEGLPGSTFTTTFTITLTDGANSASDNTTTVTATALNNPPTIQGASANQHVNDNATISPFSGVTISDPDLSGEPATITVTLDNAANGQFSAASTSDPGWTTVDTAGGTYTFSGTRAQAQTALQSLVFVPTAHQVNPGSTVTTHFTISLNDGGNLTSNNTTSVIATAVNNPPTIQGTVAGQTVNDNATISPFSGVTISDPDLSTEPATITITLDKPADGRFTATSTAAAGWTTVNVAGGIYTFTGTRAAAEAALQGLVFTPTNHQVVPGSSVTTKFTISLTDGGNSASDNTTTVVATAVNNPPTIQGTVAGQTVNDNATIHPFSGVTISDPDNSSEPATITITLDTPANGQFSAASTNPANGWTTVDTAGGIYTFSGTRAQAQAALQGLVFVPTNHEGVPGSTFTTTFTISLNDGGNLASDNTTTVTATAINNPPTIQGAVAGQTVNDNATISPFSGVTFSDPDNSGEPATFTVTLDHPLNGQFAAASTSAAGWTTVNVLTGTYTFTGTRAQAQLALEGLVFQPTFALGAPGTTATTKFTISLNDGGNLTSNNTTTVISTATNAAPVLSGANDLTAIKQTPTTNNGDLVSALIAGHVSNANPNAPQGIAVTHVDNTNGTWQYSLNGGTLWNNFGNPSDSTARLLAANALTRVRFVPTAPGLVSGGLTFRAWDQFTGTAGGTADTTTNGGSTAFSSATASSSILVNDAPVLTDVNNFPAIPENPVTNGGVAAFQLIAGKSSDVNANTLGVAVTFADNTGGSWQYSADGVHWTNIGTVSESSALLLAPLTFVRFSPNTNFFATVSPGLTVRAWDQVTGTAGSTVDLSSGGATGGTTSYSTGEFSASILVEAPPTITGATTTNISDQQTAHPFGGVVIGDPNTPKETFTVTFTESSTTSGSLSNLGGFATSGGGVYTFTGTAAAATTALQGIIFTPILHQVAPGQSVTTDFSLSVSDTVVSASDASTHVVATASNTAPTLAGAANFPAINQNPVTNNGLLVSQLISGQVTDPDFGQTEGIAITLADNTNGAWQYSTNNGLTWNNVGTVSDTQALLLTGDASTRVRFAPNATFSGTVSPGISFRAWDGFTGSATTTADTTTSGGSTAFSTAKASSSILVNDAPVLTGANDLPTLVRNPATDPGASVASLIASTASDINGNALGIAVTAVDNTNGVWQYSTDSGANWTNITAVSTSNALLLSADATTFVRFLPNNNFVGVVSPGITFNAWDHATGVALGRADLSQPGATGGTTAFSTASASAAIRINAPPTITGTVAGQGTGDNQSIQPFANTTIGDANQPAETLSVVVTLIDPLNALPTAANGQFTAASLTGWTTLVPGTTYLFTGTAAQATTAVRALVFVPTIHQVVVGQTVTTQFVLSATNPFNPTVTNAATTVIATAINDAPSLNSSIGANLPNITESPTSNPGTTVGALPGAAISDVDLSPLSGIAITSTTVGASPTGGNGAGFWEYSVNGGLNWSPIGAVSNGSALLLRSTDLVRFHPDGQNGNTGTLTYRAWDQTGATAGQQGTKVSTGVGGGTSAFSSNTASSVAIATDVNSAPVFITSPQTIMMPAPAPNMVSGNANGMVFGLPFTVDDVDTIRSITFTIDPASNPGGAFAIDPATGVLHVADASKLTYTGTPIPLRIIATQHQFDAISAAAPTQQTATIELWVFTSSASQIKLRSTTLSYQLQFDGPPQSFPIQITWDKNVSDSTSANPASPTPQLFPHFFATTPQRASQADPITITIAVTDPQGHTAVFEAFAPVPATGLGAVAVPQITAPAAIVLPAQVVVQQQQVVAAIDSGAAQVTDAAAGGGEASSSDERKVVLRLVNPLGDEDKSHDIRITEQTLGNLPALFKRLPDGRYRVYLSENGKDRLVIDVVVRQGRAVDPTDESSGTADRPPSSLNESPRPAAPIVQQGNPTDAPMRTAKAPPTSEKTAKEPQPAADKKPAPREIEQRDNSSESPPLDDGAQLPPAVDLPVRWSRWRLVAAATTAALGGAVIARHDLADKALEKFSGRSLSKAARRARRLNADANKSES